MVGPTAPPDQPQRKPEEGLHDPDSDPAFPPEPLPLEKQENWRSISSCPQAGQLNAFSSRLDL